MYSSGSNWRPHPTVMEFEIWRERGMPIKKMNKEYHSIIDWDRSYEGEVHGTKRNGTDEADGGALVSKVVN